MSVFKFNSYLTEPFSQWKSIKFFFNYFIVKIICTQTVAAAVDPHPQTFLFWSVFISLGLQLLVEPFLFVSERCDSESNCMYSSRPRRRRRMDPDQNEKRGNVQFLELDSPRLAGEGLHKGFLEKDDGIIIYLCCFWICKDGDKS